MNTEYINFDIKSGTKVGEIRKHLESLPDEAEVGAVITSIYEDSALVTIPSIDFTAASPPR